MMNGVINEIWQPNYVMTIWLNVFINIIQRKIKQLYISIKI